MATAAGPKSNEPFSPTSTKPSDANSNGPSGVKDMNSRQSPPTAAPAIESAGNDGRDGTKKNDRRNVSFGEVVLYVHPIIIGKPPAVPIEGIPITIAWYNIVSLDFSVEQFENMRGPTRTLKELRIPPTIREKWLREVGYTRQQVEYARSLYCEGGMEIDVTGGRISEGGGRRKPPSKKKTGDASSPGLFACCLGKKATQAEDDDESC